MGSLWGWGDAELKGFCCFRDKLSAVSNLYHGCDRNEAEDRLASRPVQKYEVQVAQ